MPSWGCRSGKHVWCVVIFKGLLRRGPSSAPPRPKHMDGSNRSGTQEGHKHSTPPPPLS